MYTSTLKLENFISAYPLDKLASPERILFLDIETTGFTAKSSVLYMIGCAYYDGESFYTKQWMAENYDQEKEILTAFFEFASRYQCLIHFNGNNFDLPYLLQKCSQYNLPYNFDSFEGIDIYKRIAPYKFFLKLPNCKQKTMEQYLGINREDTFTGGELIGIYHDYVKEPTDFSKNALLLHNREDLLGMLQILPILGYYDIFNGEVKAKKVQANYYTDYAGNRRQELIMTLSLPSALPIPLSASVGSCYFKGEECTASLRVPIYEEELKYFYANYKDYYYLPTEDVALHKSVASFVDKDHRIQATAATCYTRKFSLYLPQWELLFTPFFKRDYKSKELFFELTDELKKDRQAFTDYANHVLEMMGSTY
ncbi:MAG: ribonuclease H-like domain-containing protein [Lachnospiraceae bacterium]